MSDLQREIENSRDELEASNEEIIAINTNLLDTTDQLNELLKEKDREMKSQQRFTAMLNHELRNPLNGIMGNLQVSLMDETISEKSRKNAKEMYALAESMLQTVNDILDFSKMQEGKFDIVESDFYLKDVLNNIKAMFDSQAIAKGLKVVYTAPEKNYNIHSDGIRIQQIIANLMSNSIKYTKEGFVSLDLQISDSELHMDISDSGKGMTSEELAFIFEPYKRFDLENNTKIQGTGLGMCIVQSLVKNGVHALKIIESDNFHIDLIVTDNNMPEMSGKELKAALNKAGNAVPVIIVSGTDDVNARKEFEILGFAEILPKPITRENLIEVVYRILSDEKEVL